MDVNETTCLKQKVSHVFCSRWEGGGQNLHFRYLSWTTSLVAFIVSSYVPPFDSLLRTYNYGYRTRCACQHCSWMSTNISPTMTLISHNDMTSYRAFRSGWSTRTNSVWREWAVRGGALGRTVYRLELNHCDILLLYCVYYRNTVGDHVTVVHCTRSTINGPKHTHSSRIDAVIKVRDERRETGPPVFWN